MPYDPNNVLSAIDPLKPAQADVASDLGPAVRETRAVFKRLLTILFDDADAIKQVVGASQLVNGGVGTVALADLAVTAAKLADLTITAGKLASDAVETAKLKDLNVTTAKLADLAVTAAKVGTDAVTTAKIQDLAVSVAKLAADAVETAKIKDAAVTNAKLAPSAVTPDKMSATPDATYPKLLVVDTTGAVQALLLSGGISAQISGGALQVTGSSTPLLTRPMVILQETTDAAVPTTDAGGVKVPATLDSFGLRISSGQSNRDTVKCFESATGLVSVQNKNEFTIAQPGTYLIHGHLLSGCLLLPQTDVSAHDLLLSAQLELVSSPNGTPVAIYRSGVVTGHAKAIQAVASQDAGAQFHNGFIIPFATIVVVTVSTIFGWRQLNHWAVNSYNDSDAALTVGTNWRPGFVNMSGQVNVGIYGTATSTGIIFIEKLI